MRSRRAPRVVMDPRGRDSSECGEEMRWEFYELSTRSWDESRVLIEEC